MRIKSFSAYRFHSFFINLVFYAPLALLVRTSKGIALHEFFFLQIILSLTMLILEVPMGKVVDHIGYKKSLLMATLILFGARSLLLMIHGFYPFVLQAILEGAAFSLFSGTEAAYIYSIAGADNYAKEQATVQSYGTVGFILSTLSFSLLNRSTGIDGLITLTVIACGISCVFLVFSPKEKSLSQEESSVHIELTSVIKLLQKSGFRLFFHAGLIGMGFLAINFFYILKIEQLKLPEETIGLIILIYSAIQTLTPLIVEKTKRIPHLFFVLMLLISACFLGLYLIRNYIALIIMCLMPVLLGVLSVKIYEAQNNYITTQGLENDRATVLSIFNMGGNLLEVFFLLMSGVIIQYGGVNLFLLLGLLILVGALTEFGKGKISFKN